VKYKHKRSPPGSTGQVELHRMPMMGPFGLTAVPLIDNTPLVVSVLNQGAEGSCELNGWAEAIQSQMARLEDDTPELPSRQFLYYCCRAVDGSPAAADTGTCSTTVATVLATYGFPPESAWPYIAGDLDPSTKFEELKRLAYDQRTPWTARVDADGQSLPACEQAVKGALQAGYLLPFAIDVDQAFEDLRPGQIWPGPTGEVLGGHCTTIVGYGPANELCKHTLDTTTCYKVLNSWGINWCDGGYYLMSPAALSKRYDIYCTTRVPLYSGTE